MSEIIYLASYPKSGNTWVRMFITNLIKDSNGEAAINDINLDGIYSNRQTFDDVVGVKASMFSYEVVDELRPNVYEYIAENINDNLYIKIHDAFTYLKDSRSLVNAMGARAIYIIRNPLDVVVSFSKHYKTSIDETISIMNDENYALRSDDFELFDQLRQKLLSWSGHVGSYIKAKELPVHFIRYEDMKFNTFNTFKGVVEFIGLNALDKDIQNAIIQTDFKKLKQQEIKQGFFEKPYRVERFFRKGEVGDWKNYLSDKQVSLMIDYHGEIMRKYGYLDEKDKPIY